MLKVKNLQVLRQLKRYEESQQILRLTYTLTFRSAPFLSNLVFMLLLVLKELELTGTHTSVHKFFLIASSIEAMN